jgi:eukaryotic-like serine/threonine-protein kinase
MSLAVGDRVGPYEITAPLGAGGMGEVFRARDPRLGRDVAIKVLPAAFALETERVARFRREAQVLASLNHPGIAAIYGIEETDGVIALALELVDGEDLADRLRRGPIPVDEAIVLARQIADAMEAAHEKGIVHRDLKPANIKLSPNGQVKVLDFGLAKAYEGDTAAGSSPDLSNSPTLARTGTEAGLILGTAAYMSPEQARGKAVDKRADIWAFGVVLHEMLTGRRLFAGETVSDTLAAVLRQEIDLTALPPGTPSSVRRLLARCLERDPRRRLRDIGDARPELDSVEVVPTAAVAPAVRRGISVPVAMAAMLAAALAAGAAAWVLRRPPEAARHALARASYPIGAPLGLTIQRRMLAISPDGRFVATVVGSQGVGSRVGIRGVDELVSRMIPGSEGVESVFFSPDSRWVGFCTDKAIKKIPVDSSEVVKVTEIAAATLPGGPVCGSWAHDGQIYYGGLDGISAVPASGGSPRLVVPGQSLSHPHVLPDSRFILFGRGHPPNDFVVSGEVVLRAMDGSKERVLTTGSSPRYLHTGHLLVARQGGLFAAPLSLSEARLTNEPVMVVPQVAMLGSAAQYDVSETGTLVHIPGSAMRFPPSLVRRVQPTGTDAPLTQTPRVYSDPRISPDGRRLALHLEDQQDDVWTLEVGRDSLTRQTFDPAEDETPVFSPDGQWLAYSGFARGGKDRNVFRRRADGSGVEEVLWSLPEHAHVSDWSPDGKTLVVDVFGQAGIDIVLLDLGAPPVPRPYRKTEFDESSGRISPDGRWLAYRSNESGRDEIYAQTFPVPGGKVQVSTGGGVQPVWARDGRALYFRAATDFMVARAAGGPSLSLLAPVALFRDHFARPQGAAHTTYDVFPDGTFVFLESIESADASSVEPVLLSTFHWTEDLVARMPGAR